jgi:hypothetical protein
MLRAIIEFTSRKRKRITLPSLSDFFPGEQLGWHSRSLKKAKKSVLSQPKKVSDLDLQHCVSLASNVGIVHSSKYQWCGSGSGRNLNFWPCRIRIQKNSFKSYRLLIRPFRHKNKFRFLEKSIQFCLWQPLQYVQYLEILKGKYALKVVVHIYNLHLRIGQFFTFTSFW